MGERTVAQEALFYEFSLERHVPSDHLLRAIDRFVDLSGIRAHLRPFYSKLGRPSIDPELMIRMLIIGYCFGIRSERRLCEEVHLITVTMEGVALNEPPVLCVQIQLAPLHRVLAHRHRACASCRLCR